MTIYERYAQLRDAKGLNDYKMSKLTGIKASVFSEWKHGKYIPKVDKMIAIAKVLEIPLEELLEDG